MVIKKIVKKTVKKTLEKKTVKARPKKRKGVRDSGKKRINRATGKPLKIKKEAPDRGIVVVDEADVLFDADLKSMFKRQARQDIAQSGLGGRVTGEHFAIGGAVGGTGALGGGYFAYDNVVLKKYRKMGEN